MKKQSFILLIIIVLLYACNSNQNDDGEGCTPPPVSFSESDLIGTWVSRTLDDSDTIILREDGQYKQIIHKETPAFDDESGWQPWWIEHTENGIPHLHLEGMRMCVYWSHKDCNQQGGGETRWYDFCQDEWIQTPDDGVLMVLGVPDRFTQPSRGIELVAFKIHTIGVTYYQLQEP